MKSTTMILLIVFTITTAVTAAVINIDPIQKINERVCCVQIDYETIEFIFSGNVNLTDIRNINGIKSCSIEDFDTVRVEKDIEYSWDELKPKVVSCFSEIADY